MPKIGQKSLCGEGSHVIVDRHSGIVLRIEDAPPFDRLARGHRAETGTVHPERPATTGCAEEVEDSHHASAHSILVLSAMNNSPFTLALDLNNRLVRRATWHDFLPPLRWRQIEISVHRDRLVRVEAGIASGKAERVGHGQNPTQSRHVQPSSCGANSTSSAASTGSKNDRPSSAFGSATAGTVANTLAGNS
mgnify:CR=1 FL=1